MLQLRLFTIEDYDQVFDLWKLTAGMGMRSLDDSKEGIEKFLRRNPLSCFVAEDDSRIIGTILSGHDGRRGYIYHACVKEEYRKIGVGRKLVNQVLNSLKSEGINKVSLVVFDHNLEGKAFWSRMGFEQRNDLNYYNISINSDNL